MQTKFFPRFSPGFLVFFALLLFPFWASAQIKVSGTILDKDSGEPLIGASIQIKGKVTGTVSDLDGKFEIATDVAPPFTLVFSYTGYANVEIEVTSSRNDLRVELETQSILATEVVISASRVEERILESPVTIEKMDAIAIRQTAAPDFYDGISNLKGVQTTQGSMTLTSINTRGFGAVANERFVQLIDWMDNAAPLLNFPTGNIVGISELDVANVELVPGAASALYGPNAFNGILLMNSKNPFDYQGLSVQAKVGVTTSDAGGSNPYQLYSARYAKAFGKFAFKLNASFMDATDWAANDYTSGRRTQAISNPAPAGQPNFDGLNMYGDESQILVPMAAVAGSLSQALAGNFAQALGITPQQAQALLAANIPKLPTLDIRRTGFKEEDLLDNQDAKSIKFDGALHYRINDNLEASYMYRYGSGSTVYQGGERYALRDFSIQFHKLELSNPNFWLRGYMSQTDDGDSYNLSALGAFVNERAKISSSQWVPTYAGTYAGALLPTVLQGGTPSAAQIAAAHAAARAAADKGTPQPGSAEFKTLVESVRKDLFQRNPPGAGFVDNSRMYHSEFGYNFRDIIPVTAFELLVGGNYRQYDLFSDGTVFNENPDGQGENERIKINEYGAFLQASKQLFNQHLKLTGSLRYDKNENFDGQVSPRIAAVYTAGSNREHNIRASFQTGFRNPSTQGQFIFFPSSTGNLLGGAQSNAERYGIHNGNAYSNQSYNAFVGSVLAGKPNPGLLQTVDLDFVKPEKLKAIEFGYKGLIGRKLLVDFNAYFNTYNDFITGETVRPINNTSHKGAPIYGVQAQLTGTLPVGASVGAFRPTTNAPEEVTSNGVGLGLTYQLPKGYNLYGHYTYSTFDVQNPRPDFEGGFNMPENKFLIGLANRKAFGDLGFDLNYRWQDEFLWQNSFAHGIIPAFGVLNVQLNYPLKSIKTVIKAGATNAFGDDYVTNAGGPFVGQMLYVSLTFDQFMR
ncbi:MAG: carboxypeptidase-like regulatory domain-containing protein [Haliscomenobacter sp.]|nr:carboxypeptidase-like regulatory domain-containing protein [Haliscomenobacter sp.]MBK7475181.1 carboxypeptidase-like regulatory domain-containing protein [Haliscomenobacter sp.]MBK8879721.1 carboxypeptidase-like regulatory domain-containing protein [Haliscomenobacter sp.]